MQLISTPAKLTARAAQRLQACIHAVELALRELDRIGFSFESGIHRQSALQLPYMGTISHITKMHCKSTSMVVPLTISLQYDDWKSSTERTLRVPECCYRAVFFTLDHVSLSCFTAVVFSPLCCDPALSVFASKCQGVECHAVKAARCDLGDPGWGDPWFPH